MWRERRWSVCWGVRSVREQEEAIASGEGELEREVEQRRGGERS